MRGRGIRGLGLWGGGGEDFTAQNFHQTKDESNQ